MVVRCMIKFTENPVWVPLGYYKILMEVHVFILPFKKLCNYMVILQIEHLVTNFENWKKVFDSDPLNRKLSGVRAHRIFRTTGNENNIIIELEFDNMEEAEKMRGKLENLWNRVEGKIMVNPSARILETVESSEYDR